MELEVAEVRWLPLDEAPRLLAYKGEREMAAKALEAARGRRSMIPRASGGRRCRRSPSTSTPRSSPTSCARGRKTATIRLGDKSAKYRKGMIVTVLGGARYGQRERIFDAVIDKVEVKTLGELSPREIEHDNPQIRRVDEMAWFLGQLYNREVARGRHRHGDPLLPDRLSFAQDRNPLARIPVARKIPEGGRFAAAAQQLP